MKQPQGRGDRGPGVPEAVPQGLQRLVAELGVETVDRIWIFPPLVSGRKESGLLAVSRFKEAEEPDQRVLVILPYGAERTGKGLTIESSVEEQGEAPLDRFPRVMEGVVRRTETDLGEPQEVEIEGDAERFLALLDEYDQALLDPALPPLADPTVEEEYEGDEAAPEAAAEESTPAAPKADYDDLLVLPEDAAAQADASATEAEDDPFDLYEPEAAR